MILSHFVFLFSLSQFLPRGSSHSVIAKSRSGILSAELKVAELLSRNMTVYYRIHTSDILIPVLSQINPYPLTRLLNVLSHLHFDLKSGFFPFSDTMPPHVPFVLHAPSISCPLILYFSILLH
jgi:hypothetical protein